MIAATILQVNGNPDVEIEDLMPKTESELRAARDARFLAWVHHHHALTKARERASRA